MGQTNHDKLHTWHFRRFGSRSGSGRDRHQNSSSSGGGGSSEMVLDPETGEMIAAPSGGDGSNAMSDGFLVREHNSSSSSAQVRLYRVDGVDVAQETERNKATAKYVAWPS